MRKALSVLVATACVSLAWAPVTAVGQTQTVSVIAGAEAAQRDPDISGRLVVWEDERFGYDDLWVYDLATGETGPLSDAAGKQALPAIDESTVVAEDYRNGVTSNIFTFDADGGPATPIGMTGLNNRYSPDVASRRLTWVDQRNGNDDIYVYDMLTGAETAVVTDGYAQLEPAISDAWVVWKDTRQSAGANGDIYGYKFSVAQSQAICTDPAMQSNPAIDGTTCVWQDRRSDQWDIYARDMVTGAAESVVCSAPGDQTMPAISGTRVVWQDRRNGDYDIYAYDLVSGLESEVCTATGDQTLPAISGDWVVWQDESVDAADVHAVSLVPQPDLSATGLTAPAAVGIGASVPVTVTVNNGGDSASGASTVAVYLSTDDPITRGDAQMGSFVVPALEPGATAVLKGEVEVPDDADAGTYRVGAIADEGGDLFEPDESDNVALGATIVLAAPANDAFASATVLTGASGKREGDLSHGATKQPGEPKHSGGPGGASVWYRWVAPSSGRMTIDLAGSSFDTALGVYTGSSVGSLTLVSTNDDAGARLQSKLTFSAVTGRAYYVAVDGYSGESGSVDVSWTHRAELSTPVTPANVTRNVSFSVSGKLTPRHTAGSSAVKLYFYRLESGTWVQRKVVSAKVSDYSSYSRYVVRASLPSRGSWRVRAYHADKYHAPTWSSYRSFTVR